MNKKSHKKFIKNSYEKYKKIGHITCPAFNDEKIYFNKRGFRHLLYKKNDRRHGYQQKRRLSLLFYAPIILKNALTYKDSRKIVSDNCTVYFWSIEKVINYKKITVVIKQINNGSKHFFSIMDKNAKAP